PPTSWAPNFCFGDDLPTGTITISPLGPEVYPVTDVGFGFYGERVDLSMDLFQSSEAFWSSMGRRYGEIGF
ncbi:hypothetical protein ACP3WF_24015, partial [Salmonella enterica]|uniref:hypothetical protein n=1 Tax=Salmonella enterica TaxID=28901 RepID=UPI003CE7549C